MVGRDQLARPGDPEFMASLARGLAVLRCVAESDRSISIAEAARRTGLSRAAVRRCLHTLSALGYVGQDMRGFSVRRQALSLGHPYLSLTALAARAQPLLDTLRDELGESCSLGVLEDDGVLYVARAEASRIMSVGLKVGSHLPLLPTSMGRILLGGRSHEEQEDFIGRTTLSPLTQFTITDKHRLLLVVRSAAAEGFAMVDQELEMGLRSVAVPVTEHGRVVAALNVGTSAARMEMQDLKSRMLPALRKAAERLSS